MPCLNSLETVPDENTTEITVCGQKLKTTIRGRPVNEGKDEEFKSGLDREVDDKKYNIVREKRKQWERTLKIEQYHERKLIESIEDLEEMKKIELAHQADVNKREARRQARKEELEKQLNIDIQRKMEEERVDAELDKEKKQKEAEAEQRIKRYHEKQKDLISEWYSERLDHSTTGEAQAREKRRQELQAQARALQLEKDQRQKTVKQLATENRVSRIQVALEERPPLPPKKHDLPSPIVELLAGVTEKPERTPRARPTNGWTCQAKVVSNAYGLSEKEHTDVANRLARGGKGAGNLVTHANSTLRP